MIPLSWTLGLALIGVPVTLALCTLLGLATAPIDLNDVFDDDEEYQ